MFACIVLAAVISPAAAGCHPADLGLAVMWPPDRCTAEKYQHNPAADNYKLTPRVQYAIVIMLSVHIIVKKSIHETYYDVK